ncbi:MAG: prephenate dehydrogenase [Eubacteriales bacterium]
MEIAVIGLGLIGGSICKAIKKNTNHVIYGFDIDRNVIDAALEALAINDTLNDKDLYKADITFVCLYPMETITYIKNNIKNFKKGSIVCDVCGIKKYITDELEDILNQSGINFIGTHPMAGKEFSGYDYSDDKIFEKASFIITETSNSSKDAIKQVETLAKEMGFAKIVFSTPAEHDRIISFTSQLAHVVSNAYVKSPSLSNHKGFSAGSFQDLTRVAKLNETMWSKLFLLNKEDLIGEIDILIGHIAEYRKALMDNDEETLKKLLKEGRELKENSN